tara:strand:- start:7 stop:462 length:456 start_codon:yes stop_codon:yes gene_type:complete
MRLATAQRKDSEMQAHILALEVGSMTETEPEEATVLALEYLRDTYQVSEAIHPGYLKERHDQAVPHAAMGIGMDLDSYPDPMIVLDVAYTMCDVGFTLDDLIEATGPRMLISPRSYKIKLGKLLTTQGFFRRQLRRDGARQLLWFHASATE